MTFGAVYGGVTAWLFNSGDQGNPRKSRATHIQSALPPGTHKGPLLDEVDNLVRGLSEDRRDSIVVGCIEEIIALEQRKAEMMSKRGVDSDSQVLESLEQVMARAGYGLHAGVVFPLNLQLDLEATSLPTEVREAIVEGLRRYRDGKFAGAITSICGAVDRLTEQIFATKSLGDRKAISYQERISKSFAALESAYCDPLKTGGVEPNEVELIWNSHKKSVGQAA